jgi:hypothetical protein
MTVRKVKIIWGYRFLASEKDLCKIIGCDTDTEDENYDDDFNNCLIRRFDELNENIGLMVNYITCNHESEKMVRYIDIGTKVGEYNISGRLEKDEHRVDEEQLLQAIASVKNKQDQIKASDIWKYRVRDNPSLYGLPDDCLYCS